MNYHRQSRPRLIRNHRLLQRALEHKEVVASRHAGGTAYHTRATPEAEILLETAFAKGGVAIGLGTYRGVFGKFAITKWE